MWARRHKVRFVLWSESNAQDARIRSRPWVEFLKARFLRRCDGFVVPGKSAFEYLCSLGSPAAEIFTAPNAVDNTFFAKHAENSEASAGRISRKIETALAVHSCL